MKTIWRARFVAVMVATACSTPMSSVPVAGNDADAASSDTDASLAAADVPPCDPAACSDGNPCTDDSCDKSKGCLHVANDAGCSDGNACTSGDGCDGGVCLPGKAAICEDGNVCTDDACDKSSGCMYMAKDATCTDGSECSQGDACASGACLGGATVDCGDGNACTTDSCTATTGCVHAPGAGPCEDGNACNGADSCVSGVCQAGNAKCGEHGTCTSLACLCDPGYGFDGQTCAPQFLVLAGDTTVTSVAAGDATGDGKADLFGAAGMGVIRLVGKGDGTFTVGLPLATTTEVKEVHLADLTGDGVLDLVAPSASGSFNTAVYTWLGPNLAPGKGGAGVAGNQQNLSVWTAFIDGDKFADVLVQSAYGYWGIRLGDGLGGFKPISGGIQGWSPHAADLNGDKLPEIVSINPAHELLLYKQLSSGKFAAPTVLAGQGTALTLADVDGQNGPDIIQIVNPNHVGVRLNAGTATFGAMVILPGTVDYSDRDIQVGDTDGDGKPDLIILCVSFSSKIFVAKNLGQGKFAAPVLILKITNAYQRSFAVADFDGNGKMDVALPGYPGGIAVLLSK